MSETLLQIHEVKKFYTTGRQQLRAVDGISLDISMGKTLGIVGESGCGKSTLGQLLGQLLEPTAGDISFKGESLQSFSKAKQQQLKKDIQYVFQDAMSALNPRHKIAKILEEPLIIQKIGTKLERQMAVKEMLKIVGLEGYEESYIHELSGGQRQRIGIARALILQPKFIILDEPVSALDVSIQAQILNLLIDLQQQFGLTYLFISHDLHVVEHISDRVAVMYLGKIVEVADVEQLFAQPQHPYTKALLSAAPSITAQTTPIILEGDLPNPYLQYKGCSFASRCPIAMEKCTAQAPALTEFQDNHFVSCHYAHL